MSKEQPTGGSKIDVMSTFMRDTESLSMTALSVILIGPHDERRRAVAKALGGPQASIMRELRQYPPIDNLAEIAAGDYDVIVVDLDSNPERALDVVENVYAQNALATVMVYSARADQDLLVRCMRAGAREFLSEPVLPSSAGEALVRASVRRDEVRRQKKIAGKLLVFAGAKGGSGVTTVASNFAVALAKQGEGKVALIDLDLQLGDAALTLGTSSKFTVLDALQNPSRLDSDFLSVLMAQHSSGLAILAAPDNIPALHPGQDGVEKLLRIARGDFSFVVVDAGSHSIEMYDALFGMATMVYLVTQVSVADLRNSNRFVSRYFSGSDQGKLEIVLNRYASRNLEIDEAAITKALTEPARWKLPNDFAAVRRAQNSATPVALDNSALARAFAEMAKAAAGRPADPGKKKKFGLFR